MWIDIYNCRFGAVILRQNSFVFKTGTKIMRHKESEISQICL